MRWIIACLCCLLFPSVSVAKCHFGPFASVHCAGKDETHSVLAPWEESASFFPTDQLDQRQWIVEREEPKELHPPRLRLGAGPQVSYRRREVTLTQDCWHLTFRAFSKIGLVCRGRF